MKYSNKLISIDWLEVFCKEPLGACLDANYYKALGWSVTPRDYGTPQYREMFYINDEHGKPFLEIRRNPYSLKSEGGIFDANDCHIRLSNRTCYMPKQIDMLRKFLLNNNYIYKGISRIDICSDQAVFDNGMNPQNLCNDFIKEKIWKVHQSALSSHADDADDSTRYLQELIELFKSYDKLHLSAHGNGHNFGRTWNSIKWGSPRSAISTKIYNKTLELQTESREKLYIKDAWVKQGLCDLQKVGYDVKQKDGSTVHKSKMVCVEPNSSIPEEIPIEEARLIKIWRVEFSIRSDGRTWVDIEKDKKIELNLTNFDDSYKVAKAFYMMTSWNFQFVWSAFTPQGKAKRKDRCKAIELYNLAWIEEAKKYRPTQPTREENPSRTDKIIANKLLKEYKTISETDTPKDKQYKKACLLIAGGLLQGLHRKFYMSDEDLRLYQQLLSKNDVNLDTSEEERISNVNSMIDRYDKIMYEADELLEIITRLQLPEERMKPLLRKIRFMPR